tara:strand:- start:6366 stop:20885 length:14520 start_codon:yes stop_codon:yes gene_type:complete
MDGAYQPSSVDEFKKEDENSLSYLNKETERKFNLADVKYTLLSGVSLLTLTACGGGGGGLFGAFGGGGGGLLGGQLLKGPVAGARVFQDLDGDGVFDEGEPFTFTNADGTYSLAVANNISPILTESGIDTTTGAVAGSFKFDPSQGITTVTPVSVIVSKLDALIDPNTAISKFSNLSETINFNNYNPISSASEAGGVDNNAAVIDAVGAQMQATINGLSTLLSEISAINSSDPYTDAVDAIVAEINSGTVIDFENSTHIQNIFGRTSLSGSDYSSVVSNVSNAIAEVNKQIYSNFTEEGGNFLDTDARGIALLAQTDLVEAIRDLAGTPTSDAASSFGAQFSEANITSMAADLANKVPEFDPVTGAANIIAASDRLDGEKGTTVTTLSSVALNDVIVSGTAPLSPIGLSSSKSGETITFSDANFTRDIANKLNHGFSTGQKISDGSSDYFLSKLDDNHFVLANTSTYAQNLNIHEASFNQSSDNFTLAGHSFTSGNRITLFDSSNGIGQDYVIDTVSADNFTLQGSSINDALFVRDIAQKSLHGLDSGDVLTDNSQGVLLFVKKLDDDHFVLAKTLDEAMSVTTKLATYDSTSESYTLANHSLIAGDEITLFSSGGNTGVGQAFTIESVAGDNFTLVGNFNGDRINFIKTTDLYQNDGGTPTLIDRPNVVSDSQIMSFIQTDNLYQNDNSTPALSYKSFLTSITYTDTDASGSNTINAVLNSDGTVSLSIGANVSVGTHSIFYQVADADGSVAVGPVTVDISPAKPTLSFQDTISDISEVKDNSADYLEIPLHNYLQSVSLSGSSVGNLVFRGFNQDAIYKVPGTATDDNIGLFFTNTAGAPNLSKINGSSDRSITFTEASQLQKISNNLVLRLDKDFSGEISLNAYMTVTENNRFASESDVISFKVIPVADTPILTITDRSTDATIEVEGLEDQPIRIFQDTQANSIISLSSSDTDGSETVTLLLRKNLTLANGSNEEANYVDAVSGDSITGTTISHDFGNGLENAIEITSASFTNLAVKLGLNYEGNADITVAAKSSDGTSVATSNAEIITVYAAPVVDSVFANVSSADQGIEDTPFFVKLNAIQADTGESLRVFVGDFEQKDANGNFVSVDPSNISGASGFRPNIFATYSNDYFMFSELDSSTPLSGDGTDMSIEFLPLNDFNGDLRYKVFARTIETDGTSSDSSITTIIQNFEPRSENPNVEMGGNLTTNEFQGQSDYSSQKLGIGDLQVDMAENLELMRATVKFFDDTEYSTDPSTASFLNSGGNYVAIDTSSVTNMSQISIDSSTPGQYIITAYPTTSGSTVTTTAVDNLKSAMAQIGILPPEDYSENSSNGNIRVEIKIQSKEIGANISDPDGGDFTLTVTPVAKTPVSTDTNSFVRTGTEDIVTKISDGLTFSTNDIDGSESIVAVTISNIPTGFALVDSSGNAVGISDGAGSITLTDIIPVSGQTTEINYQFNGDIFLRAPNNYNGTLSFGITSTAKETNSGSTSTSTQSSLSVTVTPVADAPAVSVPTSSTSSPIKIGENVNNDVYEAIRLNTSVSEINTSDYSENLDIIIRMPKGTGDVSADLILNGGESASTYKVTSGNDFVDGLDTYVLTEAQAGKLQGATFKPPVGTAGNDYVVQVIGRSTDGTDIATTSQSITYNIAPVAKAPVINADKTADGSSNIVTLSDGDSFNIDDLIKTSNTSDNVMKLSLGVDPVASEQVTLLLSNLPSGDFISFENANNQAIGARNADGSVFVFTLSEVDINNDGQIDGATEYIELIVNAGQATLTGDRISSTTLSEFNQLTTSGDTLDGTVIRNSSGVALQETDISFNLTGFALDQVGGTTASIGLTGSGELYHLSGGDPLIIDLTPGNGFSDNFTSVTNKIDINYDGTKDTVFMPNSNTGLIIFDNNQDNFASLISSGGELSVKDHVFSEYFEFNSTRASSSLEAISLLDSNNDKAINSSDTRFSDIHIWVDADNDGLVDNAEVSQLSGNISLTDFDTSVASSINGGDATILRSADTSISYNSNSYSKVYEVALGHTLGKPSGAPSWTGKDVVFGDGLTQTLIEGLGSEGSALFDLSLTSGSSVPNGSVTLVTVRGLPDALAFNKGAKLDNGDWLLVEEDIYEDPTASPLVQTDLKLIAVDDDYSGNFSLSSWAVTTDLLGGTGSFISKSTYMVGTIQAQTDTSNLFAVTSGVTGDEDDGRDDGTTGIPLTIRYALDDSDGSETIKIQLKVHNEDIESPTSNLSDDKLKFTYLDGTTTKTLDVANAITSGDHKIFELTGLSSFDDPKVTTLNVIPAKDYASSSTNNFLEVEVLAVLTDGSDTKTETVGPILINVEEKADAIEMGYHSFTNKNDIEVSTSSIFASSDLVSSSIKTYEDIASGGGTQLLSVNSSGLYDVLSKSDGSNLNSNEISSIKLEITGIDKNSILSEQIGKFQLVNGDSVFVPKITNGDTSNFTFTVPSLKANENLKLITPDNFDGNVSFSVNSVVFANGDVAISQTPLTLDVIVYSDGSPAEISVSDANALEDGPAFRLPVNVTLSDKSESITNIKLSAAEINDVFYLTRLQTIGLNGLSDLINDTTFNTTFTDSPSLILRAAFNFKASLETVSLDNQIKNILIDDLSNFEKVSSIETLLNDFGLVEGKDWNFYATGNALVNNIEQQVFEQLDFVEKFSSSTINSGLSNKVFVENTISESYIVKSENTYNIKLSSSNNEGLANNISPTLVDVKEAQIWLSSKIGIKSKEGVDTDYDISVEVVTQDIDNVQGISDKNSGAFSSRELTGSTTETIKVKVQGTNDLPVISSNNSSVTFHEGADHVLLVTDAQFSDIDNSSFTGGSIDVEIENPNSGDNLKIFDNDYLNVDGSNIKNNSELVLGQISISSSSQDTQDVTKISITLTENASATDVTSILRSIGYKNNLDNILDNNLTYKISVQDGSGPDVDGNLSSTIIGNINVKPQIVTNLAEPDAIGDAQASTQIPLFGNIDLTGNGLPSSIQLKISDFVDGDVLGTLGTTSNLVSSSYNNITGILTFTNPTGQSSELKLIAFQDAINKTFYTTVSDNPTSLNVDLENPIDNKRIIEIKAFDDPDTLNVNEGRIVASLEVNLVPTDDLPQLNVLNFERVSVVTENGSLKIEPTFILPKLLNDDQLDSLLKTAYDNTDIIFDPDSRIKTITIEINTSSSNQQFDIIAQAQDKLNIEINNTNFNTSGEGTNKLILNLTDEQFSNQTLAENQSQIVEVLRSVKYSNEAEISNLVSGYRDVKIDFEYETNNDDDPFNTLTVFDSSQDQSLAKLFIDSNFKNVNYTEGSGFADQEITNNIDLFDDINVTGRILPQKVTVKIEDFVEGDILFSGSIQSTTGELVLTANNISDYSSLINDIKYASQSDNPDLQGNQTSRTVNVYFNENASDDINVGKIVTSSKINIISQDDKPLLNIYNFERVQIAPIDGELKVQETSLLPDSLIDEIGTDSLSLTGYNNQSFIFDPDSLIQTIKISVRTVETDQNIINEAISQDKIIFTQSEGNNFEIVEAQFDDLQEALNNANIALNNATNPGNIVINAVSQDEINAYQSLEDQLSEAQIELANATNPGTEVIDVSDVQTYIDDNATQRLSNYFNNNGIDAQVLLNRINADNEQQGGGGQGGGGQGGGGQGGGQGQGSQMSLTATLNQIYQRGIATAEEMDIFIDGVPSLVSQNDIDNYQSLQTEVNEARSALNAQVDPGDIVITDEQSVSQQDIDLYKSLQTDVEEAEYNLNQAINLSNKSDVTISVSDDVLATQSLQDNQLQLLQTLRDLSYDNPESLENLVSGYRDVKIDFVNQDGTETNVFDSSSNSSLPKLLVGKAFQPGDTHVGLNMAINQNQIPSDELITKITFTIETDYGYADYNDKLYLLNEDSLITQSLNYSEENSSFLKYEWMPSIELSNNEIISQLKDKIGFGGDYIEQSGLRTIQVDIFNINDQLIGPADLKTTVFVQEDINQTSQGTVNGQLVSKSDIDAEGNQDIISYAGYNGQNQLTIDIGFQTTRENNDEADQLFQLDGFEGAIGSSNDDILVGGKDSSKLAGGSGNDIIVGDENDFVDYSMEQAFSRNSSAYNLDLGINANLESGKIKDTYGYTDTLNASENSAGIKNIIATNKDDIIIGSNLGSQIEAGDGDDLITITGGNNSVVAGLGDDIINVGSKNAFLYGDAPGFAEGNDTFVINSNFENITIQDFEVNSDNLIIQLNNGDNVEIHSGVGTNNVKLRKTGTSDNFINVNSAAGIITATTLAIATTEVMALSDIVPATESFSGGTNDILDLSAMSEDLFFDNPFNVLWDKDDQSRFADIEGYENIIGGLGNDTILGFGNKSFGIVGGDGVDKLYGSELDVLRYDLEENYRSSGNAVGVKVDLQNQTAQDTYGNNDLIDGFNNIEGTSLNDQLIGNENNNLINGNAGNDIILGLGGNDTLIGGAGEDVIDGGTGNDTLTGDDGKANDADLFIFKGEASQISEFGIDQITDFQYGTDTARLYLNNQDIITQDLSYSSGIKIDVGSSSISFKAANTSDLNYDLSSYEFVTSLQEVRLLSEGLENLSGHKAAQGGYDDVVQLSKLGDFGNQGYFIDLGFQEMYDLSSDVETFEDLYDLHEYGNIIGSEGNDIILGGVSHKVGLSGGIGDDILYGNALDSLRFDLEEELTTEDIIGTAINKINDHVDINLGDNSLTLNNVLIDARSAEDMWGGTDNIFGIENAYGSSGDDAIFGSDNDNELIAGAGDDMIYGGSGSDILDGGDGQDVFIFLQSDLEKANNDIDTIKNFNVNEDKLSFDKLGINDIEIELIDNEGGADAVLSFNDHADWGSVILVDVGRLDTDDIIIDSGVTVG